MGVGTAGCLGIGGPSGALDYVCTALDDEPTERVPGDGSPIPFAFERPSVMEQSEVRPADGGGSVEYSRSWTQVDPRRDQPIRNGLRLTLEYFPVGAPRRPMLGSVRRQVGGERVYDQFAVEAGAILGGPEEAVDRANGDDLDQTCRESLQAVSTATLDSVAEPSYGSS